MRVLFDTNVVLDALLDRAPWNLEALGLIDAVERGSIVGVLGATTLTTIQYLARRTAGEQGARAIVADLLSTFEVAPVTRSVLEGAVALAWGDFEDAVLHEAGRQVGAAAIVSRDTRGFRDSSARVFTPRELLAALAP